MSKHAKAGRLASAVLLGAALLAGCSRPGAQPPPAPGGGQDAAANRPAGYIEPLPVQAPAGLEPAVIASPDAPPRPPKGKPVEVTLTAEKRVLEVAPGWKREVWTYNGQVPAPTIRVNQGDTVKVRLINKDNMSHSIDFHAARINPRNAFRSISAGQELSFEFQANDPGVFVYHCGTGPTLMHIANGMYGAIIVDPEAGREPAREFVLVQSEWYGDPNSVKEMKFGQPVAMAFNGIANQYASKPLQVKAGEPVRIYMADAGPNRFSAFHVVGTVFDQVQPDGNPKNALYGVQTYTVPPGGASVFETTFREPGEYPVVTHSFADTTLGALGTIAATE